MRRLDLDSALRMAGDTQAQDGGGAVFSCSALHEDQKDREEACSLRVAPHTMQSALDIYAARCTMATP